MTDISKRDFTNFEIIIYNDLRHVIKMFVTDSDTFRKGLVENSAARKFLQEAYEDNLVNGYEENDSRVFDVHYVPVVAHPILISNNESAEIDRPSINHFVFFKNGEILIKMQSTVSMFYHVDMCRFLVQVLYKKSCLI